MEGSGTDLDRRKTVKGALSESAEVGNKIGNVQYV
jgi:hypothetical protein